MEGDEKGKLKNRIYIMRKGKRLKPFFIPLLALKNASRIRIDISHIHTEYKESVLRIFLIYLGNH